MKPKPKPKKPEVPPGEPQPVVFRRWMDSFSPLLLTTMLTSKDKGLDSISIVKRKATGGTMSGDPYLRLDFTGVLLVSLDWEDDDEGVKEVGKFIYRSVQVYYRPQSPGGDLDPEVTGSYTAKVPD